MQRSVQPVFRSPLAMQKCAEPALVDNQEANFKFLQCRADRKLSMALQLSTAVRAGAAVRWQTP